MTTALVSLIHGCSGSSPQPRQTVRQMVSDRIAVDLPDPALPPGEVDAAIAGQLAKPMTANSAVRIALLNNRVLAVQLQEVGIARADYLIASQIRNPAVYVDFRLPDRRPPSGVDIEAAATTDVLDILLLPLRKKMAQQQLDQSALRAADSALQLVHDTRVAFYQLVAAEQQKALQRQSTAAASASADFARRQHDAGNIDDLTLARELAACTEARLLQVQADTKALLCREKLNRLLALTDRQSRYKTRESVDELPATEPTADQELTTAEQRRLDLCDAQANVAIAEKALQYTRAGLLTQVNIGASMERQSDHQTVVGPSLGLELPVFNQHQAQIARAIAELDQARQKLDALKVDAGSEIRIASAQVAASRTLVQLTTAELLPDRIAITEATQRQYNGMLAGVYDLLKAKQQELDARRQAVEALGNYWIARADLDRATGR